MKPTVDREWFERRVQLEEGLDVVAGLPRPESLPHSAAELKVDLVDEEPCSEETRIAFGRLINLRRRAHSLTLEALAEQADIDPEELRSIESTGHGEPDPRTVYNLAEVLHLPAPRLMELAGLVTAADEELCDEAVRFAARALPVEGLSEEERGLLEAFVQYLDQKS